MGVSPSLVLLPSTVLSTGFSILYAEILTVNVIQSIHAVQAFLELTRRPIHVRVCVGAGEIIRAT